jgi:large subunit ribosomal protein L4e
LCSRLTKASVSATLPGPFGQKKNPLKNKAVLFRLNPYAKTLRRQELIRSEKKGSVKKSVPGAKAAGEEFLKTLHAA